jgi:predicted transcriptional regulator
MIIVWLVLWDESTKSYCNLLMRYMRCRKEKKKRKEKKRGNGRRVG